MDSGAARRRRGDGNPVELWVQRRYIVLYQELCLHRSACLPTRTYGSYQGVVRKEDKDALDLPDEQTLGLTVNDADNKSVFKQDVTVSAHGTVTADVTLAADARLGFYNIVLSDNKGAENGFGNGSFYVEEYKKPEYQVDGETFSTACLAGQRDSGSD